MYDKLGGDVENIFYIYMHYIMKCVNIWKMSITDETNILQMSNAECYKIIHSWKIHSKCKIKKMDFNVREYEKFIDMVLDSALQTLF